MEKMIETKLTWWESLKSRIWCAIYARRTNRRRAILSGVYAEMMAEREKPLRYEKVV